MKETLRQMLLIEEVRNWLLARTIEQRITQDKLDNAMIYTVGAVPFDEEIDENDKTKLSTHSDSLFIGESVCHGYVLGTVYADSLPRVYETNPLATQESYPLCRRFAVDLRSPSEFLQFLWFSDGGLVVVATTFSNNGPSRAEIVVFERPAQNKLPSKILSRTVVDAQVACENCQLLGVLRCLPSCENEKYGNSLSDFEVAESWDDIVKRYMEIKEGESALKVTVYGAGGSKLLKQYHLRRYYNFACTDFEISVIKKKFMQSYEFTTKMVAEMGTPARRLGIEPEDFSTNAKGFAMHAINNLNHMEGSVSNVLYSNKKFINASTTEAIHDQNFRQTQLASSLNQQAVQQCDLERSDNLSESGVDQYNQSSFDEYNQSSEPFQEFEDYITDEIPDFNDMESFDQFSEEHKIGLDAIIHYNESNFETLGKADDDEDTDIIDSTEDGIGDSNSKEPKNQGLICDECGLQTQSFDELESHVTTEHEPGGSFPCDECGSTFGQQSLLDYHHRYTHSKRPHTCDICGQSFAAKSNLKRHVRMVHEKVRNHKCELCDLYFVQSYGLKRHMKRFHASEA